MKKGYRMGLLFAVVLGTASVLSGTSWAASLTSVDIGFDLGDLTHDESTGLDWLDLSFTVGMSPGEAAGFGTRFMGGGFRHATFDEFQTLLQSAEVAWTGGVYQWTAKGPDVGLNSTFVAAYTLLEQLGVTADLSTAGNADWRAVGWLGYPDGTGIAEVDLYNAYASPLFGVSTGFRSESLTAYATVGSFLVRGQPQESGGTSPAPVPEPGTLLLLGSGLLGIAGGTRRRSGSRRAPAGVTSGLCSIRQEV